MSFLSDREIKTRLATLVPNGDALEPEGASLDLRLGHHYYMSSETTPGQLSPQRQYVSIPRGDFAILMTKERITIPADMMAFITMKLKYKMQGLINVSGFHVDPGFTGFLTYGVFNSGPQDIKVLLDEPMFTIFFAELTSESTTPYDGGMGRDTFDPSWITQLHGQSTHVVNLDVRLRAVEERLRLLIAGVAVVAAPVLVFLIGRAVQ